MRIVLTALGSRPAAESLPVAQATKIARKSHRAPGGSLLQRHRPATSRPFIFARRSS
jgi:hypothetical protein